MAKSAVESAYPSVVLSPVASIEIDSADEAVSQGPPWRVFINGGPWQITMVDETTMRSSPGIVPEDGDVCGITYPQTMQILLADWVPEYVQRRALVHELLHACWFNLPDLTFGKRGIANEDVEETVISGIEQALFSTIHDNPALVAWLMERAEIEDDWDVVAEDDDDAINA